MLLMDTFAHALWSYIIFNRIEDVWLAVFFGVMPDLFSWTIFMIYNLIKGKFGKPQIGKIPQWVFTLYGITHSMIIIGVVFLGVFLFIGRIPLYLLAWPLHVLIDIPTHSKEFLPTPFLWPLSKYAFPGFSWGNRYFMITNYLLIVLFMLFQVWKAFDLFPS